MDYYLNKVIDILNDISFNESKIIYNNLRQTCTPSQILNAFNWKYRKQNIFRPECGCLWFDSYEYEDKYGIIIRNGVENICFIFKDCPVVYKIGIDGYQSENVNSFADYIANEFGDMICGLSLEGAWNGYNIYSQEKVVPFVNSSERRISTTNKINSPYITSENLKSCLIEDFGENAVERFNKCCYQFLENLGLSNGFTGAALQHYIKNSNIIFDLHNTNWGFNSEGEIRIFDPLYEGD